MHIMNTRQHYGICHADMQIFRCHGTCDRPNFPGPQSVLCCLKSLAVNFQEYVPGARYIMQTQYMEACIIMMSLFTVTSTGNLTYSANFLVYANLRAPISSIPRTTPQLCPFHTPIHFDLQILFPVKTASSLTHTPK